MKIALVANIPAPYRIPSLNLIAKEMGEDFLVIFCNKSEPNRNWDIPTMHFKHTFLKEELNERNTASQKTYIHNNMNVWKELKKHNPDVVITGGFNPTMLYAFAYCKTYNIKHIPITDAWIVSEQHLSLVHKFVRKFIYRFSHAFLACSQKGKEYFQSYGISAEKIFISHYAIDKSIFKTNKELENRKYDILFSGQFVPRKNPQFFVDMAQMIQKKIPQLQVLLLGDGPMKAELLEALEKRAIQFTYGGYATQKELPKYYSDTKLLLFPTEYDAWGVVAEEAMTAGTPVITTENAGCAGELVVDGLNGHVIPLNNREKWVNSISQLLQDSDLWRKYSQEAMMASDRINPEESAKALIEACNFAHNQHMHG